jgi:hypothetical protein
MIFNVWSEKFMELLIAIFGSCTQNDIAIVENDSWNDTFFERYAQAAFIIFGFVTTLPENLGTTLKVEVKLKLPNLVKARSHTELQEMILDQKDHNLYVMDEKSEKGRELKEDEILVTTQEKMGTPMM